MISYLEPKPVNVDEKSLNACPICKRKDFMSVSEGREGSNQGGLHEFIVIMCHPCGLSVKGFDSDGGAGSNPNLEMAILRWNGISYTAPSQLEAVVG
jgi:hypothetical protein